MSLAIEQAIPKVLAKKKKFFGMRADRKNVKNCIFLNFIYLFYFCSLFFLRRFSTAYLMW